MNAKAHNELTQVEENSMEQAGMLVAEGISGQAKAIACFRINAERGYVSKEKVQRFNASAFARLDALEAVKVRDDGEPESDSQRSSRLKGRIRQWLNRTRKTLAKEKIRIWQSGSGGARKSEPEKSEPESDSGKGSPGEPRETRTPTPQAAYDVLLAKIAAKRPVDESDRLDAHAHLAAVAAFLGLEDTSL